jgi:hypothetical protein
MWRDETPAQKRNTTKEIQLFNQVIELEPQIDWELPIGVRRMNLRRATLGEKPKWKLSKKTDMFTRYGKGPSRYTNSGRW